MKKLIQKMSTNQFAGQLTAFERAHNFMLNKENRNPSVREHTNISSIAFRDKPASTNILLKKKSSNVFDMNSSKPNKTTNPPVVNRDVQVVPEYLGDIFNYLRKTEVDWNNIGDLCT